MEKSILRHLAIYHRIYSFLVRKELFTKFIHYYTPPTLNTGYKIPPNPYLCQIIRSKLHINTLMQTKSDDRA